MVHICAGCSAAYAVGLPACPECGSTERREQGGASMLPQIQVACGTDGCRAKGQVNTVRLPALGVNLVQMPTCLCASCGGQVKTVTPWPPPAVADEGGTVMPKITRHGGPSNELPPEPGTAPADNPATESEGGEESSPGSSSQTSTEKPSSSSGTSKPAGQKRARTTGSPSKRARTGSSSAPGTGGGQTEPTSETD